MVIHASYIGLIVVVDELDDPLAVVPELEAPPPMGSVTSSSSDGFR